MLFSCAVMSDSLWPHRLQHTRPLCPSPPLSLTISRSLPKFMSIASVMPSSHLIFWCPLLLLPSIFPSIRDFSNESMFASDDQNTGALASASVLPMNIQGWFPLGWTGLDLLAVQGTLTSLLQHHSSKALILQCSAFFMVQLTSIHNYWKNHNFDYMDLCQQRDVSAFQYAV